MSGFAAIKAGAVSRLASPAARFRCAVTAGFAVSAVGALVLASGGIGQADDLFSAFGSLFGGLSPTPQYSQPYSQPSSAPRARRSQPRFARRHPAPARPLVKLVAAHREAPVRLGRKSMCVRLCDGFAFPVGAYHGEEDRASHEATCQAECPGARTALYVLPNGSDTIGDAVDVQNGRAYSQIPVAFHYTTFLQDSCSCHPREGNRIASLLHDFTLRRGDAVMTTTGVKVFHGGHLPYKPTDFVSLSRSRDVHGGKLAATFHAMERASTSPAVAPVVPGRPTAPSAAVEPAPALLGKQASLAP